MEKKVLDSGAESARFLGKLAGNTSGTPITDKIEAPPTLQGHHGKAWLCDVAAGLRRLGITAEQDSILAHWVIEAPWAHPAWHSYSLVLIHLRPLPDRRKTLFYLDDATHEIMLYAIGPDADRNGMVQTGMAERVWLHPGNFAAQLIEPDDDLAKARIRATVQDIIDGQLSPDTDFTREWVRRFGDNMMRDRPDAKPPVVR